MTRDRLSPSRSLAVAEGEDGYLAYDAAADRLHRLNPAASLILALCDGTRSRDEVVALAAPPLGEAGMVAASAWIDEAIAEGLLRLGASNTRPLRSKRWRLAARRLRDEGRVLAAFVCASSAVELDPDDAPTWGELAELAHIIGRREVARSSYERYLVAYPEDAEVAHILTALRDEEPPSRTPRTCIEQLYERFASFYDSSMVDDLGYRAPELLDRAIASATRGRGGLRVLDLGCGTGLAGERLRPRAAWLEGVDLAPAMVAHASRRGVYDTLHVADLIDWLTADRAERFDLIVACDTLIYFGDLRPVIGPAARLLASGGLLAFTVEQGERAPYTLTDSGRYAHHPDHLHEAARGAGLRAASLTTRVLRHEYGRPVDGLVAVFRSPGRARLRKTHITSR